MLRVMKGELGFSMIGPCLADLARLLCSKSSGEVQEATEAPTTLRSEFYGAYKRQARIFDKELREYGKELNVTLLFVSDPG